MVARIDKLHPDMAAIADEIRSIGLQTPRTFTPFFKLTISCKPELIIEAYITKKYPMVSFVYLDSPEHPEENSFIIVPTGLYSVGPKTSEVLEFISNEITTSLKMLSDLSKNCPNRN